MFPRVDFSYLKVMISHAHVNVYLWSMQIKYTPSVAPLCSRTVLICNMCEYNQGKRSNWEQNVGLLEMAASVICKQTLLNIVIHVFWDMMLCQVVNRY